MLLQFASLDVPKCSVHDDLSHKDVVIDPHDNDKCILFEWPEACIGHFLLDVIAITEEVDIGFESPETDAFLELWRRFGSTEIHREAVWAVDIMKSFRIVVKALDAMKGKEPLVHEEFRDLFDLQLVGIFR